MRFVFKCLLTCLAAVAVVMLVIPPFGTPKETSKRFTCMSHLKQLAGSCLQYASDHDGTLPASSNWMEATMPYSGMTWETPPASKEIGLKNEARYHDVAFFHTERYGYAYRSKASNRKLSAFNTPAQFELVFDSTHLERNASTGLESLPFPGRHQGRDNTSYLDGHVKSIPTKR